MSFTDGAREFRKLANGIDHHVIAWNESAPKKPIVLLHGFLDLAWSFAPLSEVLVKSGHPIFAFDWRGHGESAWVPKGGYYHFPDYVRDLDELLPQLTQQPIHLVAHSMGGAAASLFAPMRKERLQTLTVVEGLGPTAHPASAATDRMRAWLDGMDRLRASPPKPIASAAEALKRMRIQNPTLPEKLGEFLVLKGTKKNEVGELMWAFDPLHRTTSPSVFRAEIFEEFLKAIETPTQIVSGEHGFQTADHKDRVQHLRAPLEHTIAGAGHMMHWTHPEILGGLITDFIARHD